MYGIVCLVSGTKVQYCRRGFRIVHLNAREWISGGRSAPIYLRGIADPRCMSTQLTWTEKSTFPLIVVEVHVNVYHTIFKHYIDYRSI
jgi:hypothetical protein